MSPVTGLSRTEGGLLVAIVGLLAAAGVSIPIVDDGPPRDPAGAFPTPLPSAIPTPMPTPSPTPEVLMVSGQRITTYARGSRQLVVRATVSTGVSAVVRLGSGTFPLHVVDGEVTGTVPVTCAAPVPELVLAVTTAGGTELTAVLGRPAAAFAEACAAPAPGGPVPNPSGSSRGS
jgi:hypothetical protein